MRIATVLLFGFVQSLFSDEPKTPPVDIAGYWETSLSANLFKMRFVYHFSKGKDNSWTGKLNSLDEGLEDLPVEQIVWKDNQISFSVPTAKATFTGKMNDTGNNLIGTWKGSKESTSMILKRVDKPTVLKRPQHPHKPYPYDAEEVTIENPTAKLQLAATLTKPKGSGPFPVVVLISGSGPQDRDETILGHKPFLVIADHLTRKGIAVLRFDDRGVGKSTGKFAEATTEDFASDVKAIVQFLKSHKAIDSKKIGLMGHSEGGIIAPMVASTCPDVAFIVLLAGTGLPGDEILVMQNQRILKTMGITGPQAETSVNLIRKLTQLVKDDAKEEDFRTAAKEAVENLSVVERLLFRSMAEKQVDQAIKQFRTPWFRYFLKQDPRPILKQVTCPVLAVNGELDLQVPCQENLEQIAASLREGGNKDYSTKAFPQLNHLFQKCKTGSPTDYGSIEETFNLEVLNFVTDWILQRTK